ncbi:MAG: response regulator [Planctomycetota bacterium]
MTGYGRYREDRKGGPKAKQSAQAEASADAPRKLTLLIIDDEKEILKVLAKLFERHFNVVVAPGGKQGLERFRKDRPELILSDQRMRDMTGIETLRIIKEEEPGTVRMLITGYSDIDAVIEAVNQRLLDRYITKPWDNDELLAIVLEGARTYLERAGVDLDESSIYF